MKLTEKKKRGFPLLKIIDPTKENKYNGVTSGIQAFPETLRI
jgi:hypothetical protein